MEEIYDIIDKELDREREYANFIASENYVSKDVLACLGSVLTNKYAEGYPGSRYYGGCEVVDEAESLASEKLKELFKAKYVNVQPHSGTSANMAVIKALLKPNDKILSMELSSGGHLSHGSKASFSGIEYEVITYSVDKETNLIDYEKVREIALKEKPKLIIAGASSYPRKIDFKKFKSIATEAGSYLMVDMAHIAGLVAAKLHQNPVQYADVVTSTTHKTLRGPRGGIILTNDEEIIKKINKTVFPGVQGGPHMNTILAKAVCFEEALQPEFVSYATAVVKNAHILASTLKEEGVKIITDGTDNHIILIDTMKSFNITGEDACKMLEQVNITVNKNCIPYDELPASVTSGIRLGTQALTTRGLKEGDFRKLGIIISKCLKMKGNQAICVKLKREVQDILNRYPLYKDL